MKVRQRIGNVIAEHASNVFLIDANTTREITYGQFHQRVCSLAGQLQRRGLKEGDRVAVCLPNSCELAVLYFACIYLGAVIVPINPALSKSDVRFILSSCRPRLVIASASQAQSLREFHSDVADFFSLLENPGEAQASGVMRNPVAEDLGHVESVVPAAADESAVIMYTSGTSAKPKGVAHKLERMFGNARRFAQVQGIDHNSRFYLTLSMAYMGGFYNLLVLPFLCGASVAIDHVFDARSSLDFWQKAKRSDANTLWMAPTVLSILLRMDRGRTGEEFCRKSVRHAFVGFAPLPLKVKNEFEVRYGVRLIENYGLSETLFVTARSRADVALHGYVGEVLSGVNLRIVNEQGQPVATGADGEIQILTPDLMAGYLDSEGKLQETDPSEWFATGDVGHLNSYGSLSITGRKKDVILRGGVNVSPAAIEEVLLQIAGVSEVAVVSIPHELYGEDIVAVLKLEAGVELDSILDSAVMRIKLNLAEHQQPARYIAIDELPKTPNGKVQKARIRELVLEKLQVGLASNHRKAATQGVGLSQ